MTTKKIAVIVGSLRKDSMNLKRAKAVMPLAPASLALELIDLSALTVYNQDLDEGDVPASWTAFREKMKGFDGVLFVTPEYNRSVPGMLKNVIDIGSRPYGQSIWSGKPAAIISVSPGAMGGFGANHHLRQSLVFLDMPILQQPEAYIGGGGKLFNQDGKITNEDTVKFMSRFMATFASWVDKTAKPEA
ncbi:MAG: NADPH-dependent FMN reductase [Janthinobacterium lividum]